MSTTVVAPHDPPQPSADVLRPDPQVALLRVAHGLLNECRELGRSSRTLPTFTDALVVHALVAAHARRDALPVTISRAQQQLTAELTTQSGASDTSVARGRTVTTWDIHA